VPDPEPMLVVVMGVSATGKTAVGERLAAELRVEFLEGDSFHPEANIEKMSAGIPLTDEDRLPWLKALADEIARDAEEGRSMVVTCSALRRSYRDLLRASTAGVFFVHLHAPFEVLEKRMAHRTKHFMPTSLLQSQFDTLEPLQDDESGALVDVSPPLDEVVAAAVDAVRAHYDA
jgi:gluconokinase